MTYKGYQSKVELDEEAGVFHGEVINTRDVITFQGTSVGELKQAFEDSVDDYLEFCASRGEDPEKPFSGKFLIRVPPEICLLYTSDAADDLLCVDLGGRRIIKK